MAEPQETWLPRADLDALDVGTVLHALADPIRLQLVRILATRGETMCSALGLPVTASTVSHHLQILRDAGVVATRLEGTARLSRLRTDDLERRFPGLLASVLGATPAEPERR